MSASYVETYVVGYNFQMFKDIVRILYQIIKSINKDYVCNYSKILCSKIFELNGTSIQVHGLFKTKTKMITNESTKFYQYIEQIKNIKKVLITLASVIDNKKIVYVDEDITYSYLIKKREELECLFNYCIVDMLQYDITETKLSKLQKTKKTYWIDREILCLGFQIKTQELEFQKKINKFISAASTYVSLSQYIKKYEITTNDIIEVLNYDNQLNELRKRYI